MDSVPAFLSAALSPPELPKPPQILASDSHDALTGAHITHGYSIKDITTSATNEFVDTFHGRCDGYVSEQTARVFKLQNIGQIVVFEDGTSYKPLIARDSAREQGRPCWSELVRGIWPTRRDKRALILLATDFKKRLWPRARIGVLGDNTAVYIHDGAQTLSASLTINWPILLQVLETVETIYSAGFSKKCIAQSLAREWKAAQVVGLPQVLVWQRELDRIRAAHPDELTMAMLIAQKYEVKKETDEPV